MPVPTPSYPLHKVEMSFFSNPLGFDPFDYPGASPVGGWINVTADVRSASVDRGRNNDLEKVQAGTATIVLDNRTRKYDPLNTASPYWDSVAGETLLKPRRQVRICGVYPNDVTVDSFCYDLVSGNTWNPYVANNFTTRGLKCVSGITNNFTYTGASASSVYFSVHVQPKTNGWFDPMFVSLGAQNGNGALAYHDGVVTVVRDDTGNGAFGFVVGSLNLNLLPWIENDTKPLWFKLELTNIVAGTGTFNVYVAPTAFNEPDADWQLLGSFPSVAGVSGNTTNGKFYPPNQLATEVMILKRGVGYRGTTKEFDLLTDTHIPIFQGYTQGFPQNFTTYGEDATVNLECFDLMGLLGNMTTPLDYVEQIVNANDTWGWWRLGDNAETAVDSSGKAHDLVHRNKLNQAGNIAPIARGLNGVGTWFANAGNFRSRASSGHASPFFNTTGDELLGATIMFWFQIEQDLTNTGTIPLLSMWTGTDAILGEHLSVRQYYKNTINGKANNQIQVVIKRTDGVTNTILTDTDTFYNDGKAHHFALVLNNTSTPRVARIYIDGQQIVTQSVTAPNKFLHGGNISIGAYDFDNTIILSGQSQGTFNGTISDVIYFTTEDLIAAASVELTAFVIGEIYRAGLGYEDESTNDRLTRICDFAGLPSRLTAFDYNTAGMCGALRYNDEDAVLALMQRVEDTEQGIMYADREGRMTLLGRYYLSTQDAGIRVNALFSDDSTDSGRVPYRGLRFSFDGDQLANDHIIRDDSGANYQYGDSISITEYGRRTRTIETLLDDTESARQMAIGLTNIYKNPLIKAEEFEAVPLQNNWFDVLPLDIGFRVELRVTPMNTGAEIDQDLALQRIRYEINPSDWKVFVSASPRPVVSYFVLDSSELDGPDVLGF